MKVLHVYKVFGPNANGGVEKCIAQLASASAALGVHNEVLTVSTEHHERTLALGDCLVHSVPCNIDIASTPIAFKLIARLAQLAPQFDIVHYHFPWPWMDVAHFLARVRVPTVVTYHSDVVRQANWLRLYRPLMHQFLRSVDRIVATSPDYLETSPKLEQHRQKCEVIPIGLDQQSYPKPSPERLAAWRERFGTPFFLFVGVLRYYKGLHTLLEAAAGTRYPVVIVGDGPLGAALREEARRRGLTHVHFLGASSDEDKIALLTLCRAFLFPSHLRAEAFGISLLEAAMHGKPLISCDIGTGTSYVNRHGQTGLVVAPDDPVALRQAMKTLWDDPALCAAFGAQAAARYAALFTAAEMAQRYVALYHRLTPLHAHIVAVTPERH